MIRSRPDTIVQPGQLLVNLVGPSLDRTGGVRDYCAMLLHGSQLNSSPIAFNHIDLDRLKGRRVNRVGSRLSPAQAKEFMKMIIGFIQTSAAARRKSRLFYLHASSYWSFWEKIVISSLLRLMSCQVILRIHGSEFSHFAGTGLRRLLISTALGVADRVIFASETDLEGVKALARPSSREKMLLLTFPVELPGKPTSEAQRENSHLFTLRNCFQSVIVSVSLLVERKRVLDLIEAFDIAQAGDNSCCLLIAGYGPQADEILKSSTETPGSYFMGIADEGMRACMFDVADIYASFSSDESYGIGLVQALGSDIRLVTTPVGAVSTLTTDQRLGLYVTGSVRPTVEEFAEVLRTALDDCQTKEPFTKSHRLQSIPDYLAVLRGHFTV